MPKKKRQGEGVRLRFQKWCSHLKITGEFPAQKAEGQWGVADGRHAKLLASVQKSRSQRLAA
jgi:hypothetical protein